MPMIFQAVYYYVMELFYEFAVLENLQSLPHVLQGSQHEWKINGFGFNVALLVDIRVSLQSAGRSS